MPDHTPETRMALIEQSMLSVGERLGDLRQSVDTLAQRMVTHADLANSTISRSQFEGLSTRVTDLERGSPSSIWTLLTKISAGLLSIVGVYALAKGWIVK